MLNHLKTSTLEIQKQITPIVSRQTAIEANQTRLEATKVQISEQLTEVQNSMDLIISLLLGDYAKKGEKIVKSKCKQLTLKNGDDENPDGGGESRRSERRVKSRELTVTTTTQQTLKVTTAVEDQGILEIEAGAEAMSRRIFKKENPGVDLEYLRQMDEDFKNSMKTTNIDVTVISQDPYQDDPSNRPTKGVVIREVSQAEAERSFREVRDLSRITLEVLYGILKTYELEIIQRKSLRDAQGHVVDGLSALNVNESQTSNDEPRSQSPATSASEQRNNNSQEQVILELEEDEFYTVDELDELYQSMAYLARKFSNIRVKKPRFFKGKGQPFNKDSSWKVKGKYTSDSKNGYKIGSVDRSKIRCYNCDELGHFATECRKPKKANKDKAYLELEANYEALLKKQQSKAYIAEGKSWNDSDNDEDEEVGNYALMAFEQGESSLSKSQVPTLTTIDLNVITLDMGLLAATGTVLISTRFVWPYGGRSVYLSADASTTFMVLDLLKSKGQDSALLAQSRDFIRDLFCRYVGGCRDRHSFRSSSIVIM
ncbi:hypothetical protein AgCh_021763 [Apium graveolens]